MRILTSLLHVSVFVVIALCGCNSSVPDMTGEVRFDGKPINGGDITFVPTGEAGKALPTGAKIENGQYIIPGDRRPSPGKHRVEVSWRKKTGRKVPSADPPNMMDEVKEVIPLKYNKKSTLEVEITSEKHQYDFTGLKSK